MTWLVLGADGLLGSNVMHVGRRRGVDVVGAVAGMDSPVDSDHRRIDVDELDDLADHIADVDPTVVVNCLEIEDLGQCEQYPGEARHVNATLPQQVAKECEREAIRYAHFSTDLVFDGEATTPYAEDVEPNPLQVYGESKRNGDRGVCEVHPESLICRLSFPWGVNQSTEELVGFPRLVRDFLSRGEVVSVSTERHVTPSRAGTVADVLAELLTRDASGVYNVASRDCITPFSMATSLCSLLDLESGLINPESELADIPATYPRYTCLDTSKVEAQLGLRQPTVQDELETVFSPVE